MTKIIFEFYKYPVWVRGFFRMRNSMVTLVLRDSCFLMPKTRKDGPKTGVQGHGQLWSMNELRAKAEIWHGQSQYICNLNCTPSQVFEVALSNGGVYFTKF